MDVNPKHIESLNDKISDMVKKIRYTNDIEVNAKEDEIDKTTYQLESYARYSDSLPESQQQDLKSLIQNFRETLSEVDNRDIGANTSKEYQNFIYDVISRLNAASSQLEFKQDLNIGKIE